MEKLIQEDLLHDPWKMTVACILLNQTSNQQVRKILGPLFEYIKNASHTSTLDPLEIYPIIKSTGFGNIKSQRIVEMSKKWLFGFENIQDLPGVGKYAKESWDIFVNGKTDFVPTDKKLKKYLEAKDCFN